MIFALFRRDATRQAVDNFYVGLAAAARNPNLFIDYGVADTLEGRFEALILHVSLVQRRFKALGAEAEKPAQLLTDCLFADLDGAIREIGVSDIGVPRKMKMLAEAYFGRMAAYDAMLREDGDVAATLARNVLGMGKGATDHAAASGLAGYVGRISAMLSQRDCSTILKLAAEDFRVLTRTAG